MKKFFSKVWAALKRGFMMFLISTWWVWVALIIAALIGLIFGWHLTVWVFFGLVLSVILFVWFRQLWWRVTKTGDYRHLKK
jgi:hypothetical protein